MFQIREQRKGGVFPGLHSKPKLMFGDEEYLNAFYHLSYSRDYGGMGAAQTITISEITAYLDLIGERRPAERRRYLRLIQRLDQAYMAHLAKKSKQKAV